MMRNVVVVHVFAKECGVQKERRFPRLGPEVGVIVELLTGERCRVNGKVYTAVVLG